MAGPLWVVLSFFVFLGQLSAQTTTDPTEVAALRTLAEKLGISRSWNFTVDPCSGLTYNKTLNDDPNYDPTTGIKCECGRGVCRVTSIVVYNMNATGQIPPEMGIFSLLESLHLAQNLLTGRIPDEIGLLSNLQHFHVGMNNLSGPLPAIIGRLTNLTYINVGFNKLSGPLPASIGRLTNLERIVLHMNDFTGTLPREIGNLQSLRIMYIESCGLGGEMPQEFGNLTNLEELYMRGNSFNGTFPEFIGNLVALKQLSTHGNNFHGPLPSSLGNLRNINILDLEDITIGGTIPPSLNNLQSINKLMLRNCELSGSIPDLGNLSTLSLLDLSFNNLTGSIPSALWKSPSLQHLLLGSNRLSGQLPSQLNSTSLQRLDVSFNELSGAVPSWLSGIRETSIIWNQFNPNPNLSAAANCLQSRANCSGRNLRFGINCGGLRVMTTTGAVFSQDTAPLTVGTNYSEDGAWAVDSTGYEGGHDTPVESTTLSVSGTDDPSLYQNSRSAPGSLRYFGLGMVNGLYNVEIYFAEILLDNNYWGRRVFDIYLQGNQTVRDFNIYNEAGGSSRALNRTFRNVKVTNNVLNIHFVYRGKGTFGYGPIVAAIRVDPGFSTGDHTSTNSKAAEIGVGFAVAAVVLMVLATIFLVKRRRRQLRAILEGEDLKHLEGRPDLFTYAEMKNATRGFSEENKLGQGGFGAVYKGVLPNGKVVAIKELSSKSQQGSREFLNEVTLISSVQHRNLVKLQGCCIEGNHRLLVYEFLEKNSLHRVLLSSKAEHLDWPTRFNICVGIARGIAYLHEDSRPKIVHRDIKASNVLLDKNMTPKIADFGLAKLFQDHETHVSTRVAGTIGYLSPEYAMRGQLTEKADVYSFGVLALEIVSGRNNLDTSLPANMMYLLEWAWNLYESNKLLDLVDEKITEFSEAQVVRVIQVALLCSQAVASSRPVMSHVVGMLVGTAPIDVSSLRPGYFSLLKDAAPGLFSDARRAVDQKDQKKSGDEASSSSANSSYALSSITTGR